MEELSLVDQAAKEIIDQIIAGTVEIRIYPECMNYILVDQYGNQIEVEPAVYEKVCEYIEHGGIFE